MARPLDRADVEDAVLRIAGTDRYAVITQNLRCDPDRNRAPHPRDAEKLRTAVPPAGARPAQHRLELLRAGAAHAAWRSTTRRCPTPSCASTSASAPTRPRRSSSTSSSAIAASSSRRARISTHTRPERLPRRRSSSAEYRVKRTGAGIDVGYTTGMRSRGASRLRRGGRPGTAARRPAHAAGSQRLGQRRVAALGVRRPEQPARAVAGPAPAHLDALLLRHAGDRRRRGRRPRTARDVPQGEVVAVVVQAGAARDSACSSPAAAGRRSTTIPASTSFGSAAPFRLGCVQHRRDPRRQLRARRRSACCTSGSACPTSWAATSTSAAGSSRVRRSTAGAMPSTRRRSPPASSSRRCSGRRSSATASR